jgi:hypothetical protein
MAVPKGNLEYIPGDAFLLHVFWEAPTVAAARTLLSGLQQCATATHRDTPCVPLYFFRISNNNAELCSPPPRTVGEHPQLCAAIKKLQFGTPPLAVHAELTKRGIDPGLADLDPSTALPAELQERPVALEFTELYLDERAFMEHAGSRDYLNGYAVVMDPALHYSTPRTMRLGTPPAGIIERILEPILHEVVAPLPEGCSVWQRPLSSDGSAVFLSLDVAGGDDAASAAVAAALPSAFREHCTTCVAFAHPLRPHTTRLMCVLPSLPPLPVLACLAALEPARGEAHVTSGEEAAGVVRAALVAVGLGAVIVNASESVGYILHAQAAAVHSNMD